MTGILLHYSTVCSLGARTRIIVYLIFSSPACRERERESRHLLVDTVALAQWTLPSPPSSLRCRIEIIKIYVALSGSQWLSVGREMVCCATR